MADSGSRDFTRAEQSYVAQVTYQLRHEPERRQHQLLQALRRVILAQRPVDGYARLEQQMGTPARYAATLLGGDGDDADAETSHRKKGRRRGLRRR